MLKAAVDDGVIAVNPAEKLGRLLHLGTSKQERQENIKAMTREQRFNFLQSASHVVPRYYPLFLTLAGTGLRLGEALALQFVRAWLLQLIPTITIANNIMHFIYPRGLN